MVFRAEEMFKLRLNPSILVRHVSAMQRCRDPSNFTAQISRIPATFPTTQKKQSESGFGIIQQRGYRVTTKDESAVVLGGLALAATAVAGQYVVKAWSARKAAKEQEKEAQGTTAEGTAEENGENTAATSGFSGSWFARTFYDGGFEEKMSRREAALILGVRETANAQRIKEAHRRILLLNHPDTGGSTFLATKINQAKELLLKGKNPRD